MTRNKNNPPGKSAARASFSSLFPQDSGSASPGPSPRRDLKTDDRGCSPPGALPVGVQEPAPGRPSYSMEVWGETDYGLRGGQGERAEKLDAEDRLIARLGCYSLVALAVVIALVWAIHGGLL